MYSEKYLKQDKKYNTRHSEYTHNRGVYNIYTYGKANKFTEKIDYEKGDKSHTGVYHQLYQFPERGREYFYQQVT